ncbi:MAG: EVE domain-containing protein [Paraglaciecola sp.]|nr:EVE domain-containing protein [Paraglaciecola sp.]
MLEFDSISAMISECFEREQNKNKQWYDRYQQTYEKVKSEPESDAVLQLLWHERNNAVASLMQGNTSKAEFEKAKERLKALTATIVSDPSIDAYEKGISELKQIKDEGIFRQFYGSLLNRVFGAIAPDKVTSCAKESAFQQAAEFINTRFDLRLSLQGNWFQNNVELKSALKQKLSGAFDDFQVNIAIWNVYELLEQAKQAANTAAPQFSTFVLQGNPKIFDVDGYVEKNTDIFWTVSRYSSDMALGDRVFIWRAGANSGAIAFGKITQLPQTIDQLKLSSDFNNDALLHSDEDSNTKKVKIQIEDYRLSEADGMITREEAKKDNILSESLLIKSPQGTVFKLSEDEADQFYSLWQLNSPIDDDLIESELAQQHLKSLDLTVEQYKEVLQAEGVLGQNGLKVLTTLFLMPGSKATSKQLSKALGYGNGTPANALIGKLSKRIGIYFGIEKADIKNQFKGWWQLIASGERVSEGFVWTLRENLIAALVDLNMIKTNYKNNVQEIEPVYKANIPLNQIFYGPPGTGKTHLAIEAAVRAAEPKFIWQSRPELKSKYDELVAQKRIQFVTFHQSYGYEEFVEGLRATSDDGLISYEVQSGAFKRICNSAANNMIRSRNSTLVSFEVCWDQFLDTFDDEQGTEIKTKKSKFLITEVNENTIYFEKSNGKSKHTLAIKTLKEVFNGTKLVKGGLNVYYSPLVVHLKKLFPVQRTPSEAAKNFVLIIDEINRGNISKIFGELITLIEDSKRSYTKGNETIEVTLPYSGDPFSVPANLYLIGTMNTADRSLAMMDTALRRRFDFFEMMPDYSALSEVTVKGIALDKLLLAINSRIEALYDREHTLGHAFFIPVKEMTDSGKEAAAFEVLKQVFIKKIIPLLEEYFFDDWNKIRLVLADNQKPEFLQLVKVVSHAYDTLFGNNNGLDNYVSESKSFALTPCSAKVWNDPAAYISIYDSYVE